MLVDDDSFCLMLNRFVLETNQAAASVVAYDDPVDALKHLGRMVQRGEPHLFPDVILLDLNMSSMDGWCFLERFASFPSEYREKSSIYILTSSIQACDRERAHQRPDVCGYIEKPFSQHELEHILARRVSSRDSDALLKAYPFGNSPVSGCSSPKE